MLTQAFDDVDVRRLLAGDESGIAEAFQRIERTLRGKFMQGARDRMPWLGAEDLADIWQDTLRDLLSAIRGGRVDLGRALRPWLWTVFQRRALDHVGEERRQRLMWERAKERLRGTSVGALVESLSAEERARVMGRIRRAVETLPERQKAVIQTFIERYPLLKTREDLRRALSERTGKEETGASVRRAMEEARRKVAEILRRSRD